MSKPRITQVLWALERAGAERVVFDVISCLRDRYEFQLVAAAGGEMEREFRDLGIEVVTAPQGASKLDLLRFFAKEFEAHRPDLLHTHLGGDVWAGMVARWKRIRPWISTMHNEDMDDPWGRTLLRRMMASGPDQIACVSHTVKAFVHTTFGVPLYRLTVVSNGIDFSSLHLRPPHPFHDVPRLLCIGRLTKQKGQETLLRALAQVKRPWRLAFCGEGPDRQRLERLTESLGLLPRVSFLGVVSDVRRRLAETDLVCVPSRWEGQGIALLEATASGVPVILSDLPVFRELFDAQAVAFAPVDDPERWAQVLHQVLEQPSEAIRRATEAQQIVRLRSSREKMADTYAYLYDRWLTTYAHSSRK